MERGERKDEEVVQVRKAERGRKEEERKGEDVEQSIEQMRKAESGNREEEINGEELHGVDEKGERGNRMKENDEKD